MPLLPDSRLGPYEIVAPLGAGGMGEVYRARDPRMGREVAIKLCGERFSDRFEREVRAIAALNHANICHIYDVGPNYLVMELVEGPTLAERIQQGAIPLEEALIIARQIGDALEAAHEKGIIHRDLKPANIKIKPDGTVKVFDFGLAKMEEQAAAAGNPDDSPTVGMGTTLAGQIVGTAAYMAPEQARGNTVDKRADIWAFGVVLYEMLTGRRLFEGKTISDTLAGVLTREPDWRSLPPKTQALLKSCLEKEPKRRLRDVGDAWRLLEDAPAAILHTGRAWKFAAAGLTAICAVALWAPWRGTIGVLEKPSVSLDVDLGPGVAVGSSIGPSVILSPDGSRVVFVSRGPDETPRLFTRRLSEPAATALAKTEGAYAPFFSPDGLWVGYFGSGKLWKTRLEGGDPVSLCDAPEGRGASWGKEGIVASIGALAPLSFVPADGGNAVPLTELEAGELTHRWPQFLPGDDAVLYEAPTAYGNFDTASIGVVSLKDRRKKTILPHVGMYPRYLSSGHLVYVRRASLLAMEFDLKRLEAHGAPVKLQEVANNLIIGSAQYDVSQTGTLVYHGGRTETQTALQWLDSAGESAPLGLEPGDYFTPRLSPSGDRLAFVERHEVDSDIYVADLVRGGKTRLTNGMSPAYPLWTPDGQFVVFQAAGGMFAARSDGAGTPQPLLQSNGRELPSAFTPDGTRLLYTESDPHGAMEIRIVPIESAAGQLRAKQPQFVLKTVTFDVNASFSPDGRWLAYGDAQGGITEVYVRHFPDTGARVQVSNSGGSIPVWSRDGKELFYHNPDQRVMVVNYVATGDVFTPQKPRVWTAKQLAMTGTSKNFDLAPDGKRVLAMMPVEPRDLPDNHSHVTVMINFFDEVRHRIAAQSK